MYDTKQPALIWLTTGKITNGAEEFCRELHNQNVQSQNEVNTDITKVPAVMKNKLIKYDKKVSKVWRQERLQEDGIIKDTEDNAINNN